MKSNNKMNKKLDMHKPCSGSRISRSPLTRSILLRVGLLQMGVLGVFVAVILLWPGSCRHRYLQA